MGEHVYDPARDFLNPPEVIVTTKARVDCDGGGGALGHPRVWFTIDPTKGYVDCNYCDRRFALKGGPADSGA